MKEWVQPARAVPLSLLLGFPSRSGRTSLLLAGAPESTCEEGECVHLKIGVCFRGWEDPVTPRALCSAQCTPASALALVGHK